MKRLTTYGIQVIAILLMLSSCSRAEEPTNTKEELTIEKSNLLKDKKILIVYLSSTKKLVVIW
jgi:hypothetical protein